MIDRNCRELLTDAIHSLIAGHWTNDEFDHWLWQQRFNVFREPDDYGDAALGPVLERSWCLYSDSRAYRLIGRNRLPRDEHRDVLRWILFLRSDLEYEWPPFRFLNPALLSTRGCLFSLLTFGLWPSKSEVRARFDEWKQHGDFEVWPFLRTSDYDRVYRRTCPLESLKSA